MYQTHILTCSSTDIQCTQVSLNDVIYDPGQRLSDHGQYLVEHVLAGMCNSVSRGLMCSRARWVPGDWAALGQGWSLWHWADKSEASMGQLLTNQRPGSGVWAPLVSRATDHHHQKPLISLTAGKIVKLNFPKFPNKISWFFCCLSPNIIGDSTWLWEAHGL